MGSCPARSPTPEISRRPETRPRSNGPPGARSRRRSQAAGVRRPQEFAGLRRCRPRALVGRRPAAAGLIRPSSPGSAPRSPAARRAAGSGRRRRARPSPPAAAIRRGSARRRAGQGSSWSSVPHTTRTGQVDPLGVEGPALARARPRSAARRAVAGRSAADLVREQLGRDVLEALGRSKRVARRRPSGVATIASACGAAACSSSCIVVK